jgi:hypothetical protein
VGKPIAFTDAAISMKFAAGVRLKNSLKKPLLKQRLDAINQNGYRFKK